MDSSRIQNSRNSATAGRSKTTISSFNKITSDCGSSRAKINNIQIRFLERFLIDLHPSSDSLSIVKKSITDVVKSNVTCRVQGGQIF